MAVLNIGIDLGVTAKHHAEVINSEGIRVCSSVTFPGTKEGFDMVSKHALKHESAGCQKINLGSHRLSMPKRKIWSI
jgi:hypothetical protein